METEQFQNFMVAEYAAKSEAISLVQDGAGPLAFYFIDMRNAGNELTKKEKGELKHVYRTALLEAKYQIMLGYLYNNQLKECRMLSRYFSKT